MELAEIKKYFENVEFVETATFKEKRKVNLKSLWIDGDGDVWCTEKRTGYNFFLWSPREGFAKILTTKEPSFSITKDQLRQLTDPKVKEWFPEVFVKKLEVGKWYKHELIKDSLVFKTSNLGYGWFNGTYSEVEFWNIKQPNNWREATEQEVFEALKNEAVKRGFVEGNAFEGMENSDCLYKCKGNFEIIPQKYLFDSIKGKTVLEMNSKDIFKDGIWTKVYRKL